ncbi:hypothetical protein PtA15_5A584 [Puccinia triticina]|uniref:Uncharacterized protein n=1 Tax=Puccinia triticina TaxID=208348 RepID=A0ABY7CIE8_9BASI|nr:uncharacterized protein PtA15_5A584 [Puccinia triticina]WAQ85011.1 hypothetical protein PtA15_5A584 [Puccinia triticina]
MSDGREQRADSLEGDQFRHEAHILSSIGQEHPRVESPVSFTTDESPVSFTTNEVINLNGDVDDSSASSPDSHPDIEQEEETDSVDDNADPVVLQFSDDQDKEALRKIKEAVLNASQYILSPWTSRRTCVSPRRRPRTPSPDPPLRDAIESLRMLGSFCCVFHLSMVAIWEHKIMTKRDMLSSRECFENQAEITRAVNFLAARFQLSCEDLHIVGSVRRFFPGNLEFMI